MAWKQLSESDVKSRLAVCKEFWNQIEPAFPDDGRHVAEIRALDGATGMYWEFQCAVRRSGPHKKPVFQSEGWLKFVNHKGLAVGDRIVLEPGQHEFRGTSFVITAQRLSADDGQRWVNL